MKYCDLSSLERRIYSINEVRGPLDPADLISFSFLFINDYKELVKISEAVNRLQFYGFLKLDFSSGKLYNTGIEEKSPEFRGEVEFDIF